MTRILHQRRPTSRVRESERGSAMIVVTLVMLLIGTLAVSAINQAGEEAASSGRTRAVTRNLYAADSGVQIAAVHLAQLTPDITPFSFVLEGGKTVESRRRSDAAPQPLTSIGFGPPPEGYEINVGSEFSNEIFLIHITSVAPNGTSTELETKLARLTLGSGGQ